MRILVVNWMDPANPRAGGAERHLLEIFSRLAGRHRITLLASGYPGGARRAVVGGLEVVRVGGPLTFALAAPVAARRLLAGERFDLLVEDLNKLPLALPRRRVPTMVLAHHLWGRVAFAAAPAPLAAVTWLAERLIPALYRNTMMVAVSPSTRRELIERGIPAERVAVVENAVEAPPPELPSRATEPLFVSVGRLQRYKRVDLLIEAAATLEREGHRFRVVIAGQGPDRRRLGRLARRRGTKSVELVGSIGDAARDRLLGQAWANVLMSRKEGWGLTVLEASRMGTPSVVAFAPGLWDAVRHLEDGIWVPYHELPTLADALRWLLLNPAEVERLGAAARRRVSRRTWDVAASELGALIEAVAFAGERAHSQDMVGTTAGTGCDLR